MSAEPELPARVERLSLASFGLFSAGSIVPGSECRRFCVSTLATPLPLLLPPDLPPAAEADLGSESVSLLAYPLP